MFLVRSTYCDARPIALTAMPITRKFKFGGGKRDGRADLDSIDTGFQHLDIGASAGTELSTSVLGN